MGPGVLRREGVRIAINRFLSRKTILVLYGPRRRKPIEGYNEKVTMRKTKPGLKRGEDCIVRVRQ